MVYCGSCGAAQPEESVVCAVCGAKLCRRSRLERMLRVEKRLVGAWDETWRFPEDDIASARLAAMLAYLPLGAIVSFILASRSPFARFHRAQGWRLLGLEAVLLGAGLSLTGLFERISPLMAVILRFLCMIPGILLLAVLIAGCAASLRGKALELPLVKAKKK